MLSRVADSLYWMARYLERAEHTARVVEVQTNLILDQTALSPEQRWNRVLACLGDPVGESKSPADSISLVATLLADSNCRASIITCINGARENARQVRQQVSSEMWEQLNRLYHDTRRAGSGERRDLQPLEFLHSVQMGLHLFQGITDSTISHGEGWQFIQIGRNIERVLSTAQLLDVHFAELLAPDIAETALLEWIGLLKCSTAFEAYCRHYTADVRPEQVAEFLLLNDEFPHSVRFAVDQLQIAINRLPDADGRRAPVLRLVGRLRASLSFAAIDEMIASGIHTHLFAIAQQCGQIHNELYQAYIDYPIESALSA